MKVTLHLNSVKCAHTRTETLVKGTRGIADRTGCGEGCTSRTGSADLFIENIRV